VYEQLVRLETNVDISDIAYVN